MTVLVCSRFVVTPYGSEFHVSPTGSDLGFGTASQPFKTLERARDAVRALKRETGLPSGGVTIWLHGGDYFRTNTLELTPEDSGSPSAPVVWRSVPNQKVRLTGGRVLSGFRPVTDTNVLARLEVVARTNVVQLDLRSIGIEDLPPMKSRGFGRPTTPSHA
ncbi:MAG: hypothetical protein N3G20_12475, partial [Verrucomicrobiae bacterium]|nr:hypothetical protein [Verrucomicrobiae bacterium]